MKTWLTAVFALLIGIGVRADEITLEQAETAVGNWIARGGGFGKTPGGARMSGETLEDPDTGAKMHLVRIPGKGFVVTSADDGIEPIVLFSDGRNGDFAAEKGNPVWDLLRWDIAARAAALEDEGGGSARLLLKAAGARGSGETSDASPKGKWAALLSVNGGSGTMLKAAANRLEDTKIWDMRCRPLLKTRWNQVDGSYGGVYNLYTPEIFEVVSAPQTADTAIPEGWVSDALITNSLGRCPAGCVAVAGGQLMKYWEYPKSAVSEKDVKCHVDGEERMLHFYGTQVLNGTRLSNYRWDNMGVVEPTTGFASECVSRLLSDIGVICGASYTATATAMGLYTLTSELKSTFKYQNAVYYAGKRSGTDLQEVVIPNLDAGCPVLMGIGHAHAVVADGYGFGAYGGEHSTFYLHINLGWGYSSHYWYSPPDIEKYSTIDEIVCNVFPDRRGQLVSGRVVGPNGRPVYNMNVCISGATLSSVKTGTNGIYHDWVSTGDYQVWAQDAYGTPTTPTAFTVESMSYSVNGNRIVNIAAPNADTVGGISMAVPGTRALLRGTSETTFSSPFSVSLSCETAGAEIHYTLDGSTPTADSAVYKAPIAIQATTTLQAIAFADGMECSDVFEQTWTFVDPVSRDNFANARPIEGASGHASFNNIGYTRETGEPYGAGGSGYGGASAWASWTAPADGDYTFWLSGTTAADAAVNTLLTVYTGNAVTNLSLVAQNDDVNKNAYDYSSRVSFSARVGTTYKVAMDAKYGRRSDYCGDLTLRWEEGFVHYARLAYATMFAPVSGGQYEIGVESSAGWKIVECSDWIVPGAISGGKDEPVAFSIPANTTGGERTGFLTIQAGTSELETLSIRQHPSIDFVTTKEEAVEAAWRSNKRILLVNGRETCGNTISTLFYSAPSSAVKPLLDAGYVIWYHNFDRQSEADIYGYGEMLPTVCVLDPLDMSTYVARTTGYQSASDLATFLRSAPAWSGLPEARMAVVSASPSSATLTTWVRAWGSGASSATVTLETSSSATFSSLASSRTLGTVTSLWTEQEWTFAPPSGTESAFCRVRISSGNWAIVSDVVVFVPFAAALDNPALSFETGGDVPWTGTLSGAHDGVDVARSGQISHSQSSWIQTAVTGPGTLSFWWKASSENQRYDYLKFSIDGSEQARIGGTNVVWALKTVSIGKGIHVLRWEYLKDSSVSRGSDCGWVDQISWTGGTPGATYTVTYDPGSHGTGLRQTETKIQNVALTLEGAIFTRAGYVQTGWSTSDGGSKAYGLSASYGTNAAVTLYPYWTENTYSIRFHRNDASDGRAAERGFDYGESKRLPSLASLGWARRGFDFLGWATSEANASKGVVWKKDWASVSTAAAVGKTLDVWAVWKLQADSYAIRFIRNDGAGTWRTVGFKHGVKTRMPSLANGLGWGRRGYEFKGWALTTADANAGKVWKGDWAYVSEPVAKGKSLDVYAVWALKPGYYQIRFNKNDGTGKWRSLGFQRDASTRLSTIAALGWTRTGYSFAGWASSKANADAGKVWKPDGEWVKNAAAEGKTLSIYAIWRKAPETVPMPRLYESQVVAAPSAAAPAAFEPIFRTGELADGSGEYALSLDFLDADGVMSGHFVVGAEAATSAYACDAVWLGDNLLVETEDGDLAVVSPDGTATLL